MFFIDVCVCTREKACSSVCFRLCSQVYGSDLCLPAIEDAKKNAQANGIKNCEFVCGKVSPPPPLASKCPPESIVARNTTSF